MYLALSYYTLAEGAMVHELIANSWVLWVFADTKNRHQVWMTVLKGVQGIFQCFVYRLVSSWSSPQK